MAGDKVNLYAQDDSDILALQLTTDKTFKGYHQLTLTEYDTTTVPAIAAGSAIECNGALYKFDAEEAISTTDPVTSATVADGTVYVCIVPGATTATAAFTATAPTWSDSKQGWYGTGGQANYRYAEYIMVKASTAYSYKNSLTSDKKNIRDLVIVSAPGDQSISTTNETVIQFTVKTCDYNNSFNISNSTFTAPYTGVYLFNANAGGIPKNDLRYLRFQSTSRVVLSLIEPDKLLEMYGSLMAVFYLEKDSTYTLVVKYLSPPQTINAATITLKFVGEL